MDFSSAFPGGLTIGDTWGFGEEEHTHNCYWKNETAFSHGWNATYTNEAEIDANGTARSYRKWFLLFSIFTVTFFTVCWCY